MKRYRIDPLSYRFDNRATHLLTDTTNFEEQNKLSYNSATRQIIESIINAFGVLEFENKVDRFKEFGDIKFSIKWQYIQFILEIRRSYVMGAYYPALAAAGTLGERILNHLFHRLKNYYHTPSKYQNLIDKDSVVSWDKLIFILSEWSILIDTVPALFSKLKKCRDRAVHYDFSTEVYTKEHALEAIKLIMEIVSIQFGPKQDYIFMAHDALCIKNSAVCNPYVKHIVLENTKLVGFKHMVIPAQNYGFEISDIHEYGDKQISDEEYTTHRKEYLALLKPAQDGSIYQVSNIMISNLPL